MKNKYKKKNILIKIAYSKSIGSGHFYRCIFLAKELLNQKVNVFICFNKNFTIKEKNIIKKQKINYLDQNKNFSNLIKIIKKKNIQNLLIDDPTFSYKNQLMIKKHVRNLILYQDIPSKNYCDVIINHNLIVNGKKIYKSISMPGTKFFLGLKNFFLINNKLKYLKKKDEVLIFFGGFANSSLIKKTLKIVSDKLFKGFKFNLIIGNLSNPNLIKSSNKNINIIKSTKQSQFHKKISLSKFILCSGGTTLIEAIIFKTFPIVIQTALNQKYNISYLKNKKKIILLGNKNFKSIMLYKILKKKLLESKFKLNYSRIKYFPKKNNKTLSNKLYELLN